VAFFLSYTWKRREPLARTGDDGHTAACPLHPVKNCHWVVNVRRMWDRAN
jgi:hypothetical protein